MEPMTILILVFAVIVILFLFVILFIQILRLQRKAKLQTKIALMENKNIDPGVVKELKKMGYKEKKVKKNGEV